jgi:hypothetical protein
MHMSSRLRGYHLVATDGEIGHVDDFVFDEGGWALRYLAVDTSNRIGGKSVLIAPAAIQAIDTANKLIRVNLSKRQIENSPAVESAGIAPVEPLPTVRDFE